MDENRAYCLSSQERRSLRNSLVKNAAPATINAVVATAGTQDRLFLLLFSTCSNGGKSRLQKRQTKALL
ncbi:MAG: hypothetical protein J7L69_01360 [Desulfobulbaceae bacterium]|nr:hypothetical protein [Desulfobulbaceae bacterium]